MASSNYFSRNYASPFNFIASLRLGSIFVAYLDASIES